MNGQVKKEVKFMDTMLDVPYFSQYRDIGDKDHRLTACGMTCVHMALSYYGVNGDDLESRVQKGVQEGGYGQSGWIHDYLVSLFRQAGITCERAEGMSEKDVEQLVNALRKGDVVIVSAQRRMFDRRIFHVVLLTGYRETEEGTLEGFFYHDPAALRAEDGKGLYVPLKTFMLDWRRMAIFPSGRKAVRA